MLSGGERRRLSLAILVSSGANVLILDEPTNHLDLESREALERALSEFQGSILLVSHDRALLDAVGSRTMALEEGALRSYVGGWPEYLRVREERAAKPQARKPAKSAKPTKPPKPARRARKTPKLPPSQEALEREIEAAEAALHAVEGELTDPTAWAGAEAAARSTARHERARQAVEQLYEQLERVTG